jgi:hypothetical protein
MPIQKCTSKGKKGTKAGPSAKCYTGKNAKSKARKQLGAMFANGYKSKGK